MGYSYTSGRLCCDACGQSGGVRKRTCPYTVTDERGQTLPYCYPSALCAKCYAERKARLHGAECKAGAAASQARYDEKREALNAGKHLLSSAISGIAGVPAGFCRVTFRGQFGAESVYLIPDAEYDARETFASAAVTPDLFPNSQRLDK